MRLKQRASLRTCPGSLRKEDPLNRGSKQRRKPHCKVADPKAEREGEFGRKDVLNYTNEPQFLDSVQERGRRIPTQRRRSSIELQPMFLLETEFVLGSHIFGPHIEVTFLGVQPDLFIHTWREG